MTIKPYRNCELTRGINQPTHIIIRPIKIQAPGYLARDLVRRGHRPTGRSMPRIRRTVLHLGGGPGGVLLQVPDPDEAVAPHGGGVLAIRGCGITIKHPDVVGAGGAIDLRDLDPDVGGAGLVPLLDLMREEGGAVRIREAKVLALILRLAVVDAATARRRIR